MYISFDSNQLPAIITARWRRESDSERPRIFLSFGSNMTVVLTPDELRRLAQVIEDAFQLAIGDGRDDG